MSDEWMGSISGRLLLRALAKPFLGWVDVCLVCQLFPCDIAGLLLDSGAGLVAAEACRMYADALYRRGHRFMFN